MPYFILKRSHTSHTQCDHSPRNEFIFLVQQNHPSYICSLRPLEIFLSMGITRDHPFRVPLGILEIFLNIGVARGHPHWVPLSPLEYFLSIGSSSMGFHQPLRNFSKYKVFLHKFLMTSEKIF